MTISDNKYVNGTIHRIAGTQTAGKGLDGEFANQSKLNGPAGLAIDQDNNVLIAEVHNNLVRKIDVVTNIMTTIAGCGVSGFGGDGGLAIHALLNGPEGVFIDSDNNIYIADTYNHRIRRVDAKTGIIKTVAGNGEIGYNGDYINACEAMLNFPSGVVVDSKHNVYFNDYKNNRIRRIDSEGIISTVVGNGTYGYSGDGESADKAQINEVYGLGIDQEDNIYLMDSLNFAVRKVEAKSNIIRTVVGKGRPGDVKEFESIENCYIGLDTFDHVISGLEVPHAVEVMPDGNLFIADTGCHRIRMVDFRQNIVYTVAGNGEKGCTGDDGRALDARLCVHGLRMSSNHNLYFVDFEHHMLRVVRF